MAKPAIQKKAISIKIPVEEWEILNSYAFNEERTALASYVTEMVRSKAREIKVQQEQQVTVTQ